MVMAIICVYLSCLGTRFLLDIGIYFPYIFKKQRAIMNIVLKCFVWFFLFAHSAFLYLTAITFRIQSFNLKNVFAYRVGVMPCLVAQHPQTPGAQHTTN